MERPAAQPDYRTAAAEGVRVAVDVRCELGEGPIWHPDRGRLLWFDILRQVLYEEDDPTTRSNDGRVGPGGAFWIGTMGWGIEADAGGLYRYAKGAFTTVKPSSTCPNALAFSPDGTRADFSETFDHRIVVIPLDPSDGTPAGEPELFLDLSDEGLCPDGAVVDEEGCLWSAQFGPGGRFDRAIEFPVSNPTCPAFGGSDHKTLFVTTARVSLSPAELKQQPLAGAVFAVEVDVAGLPKHRLAV